MKLSEEMKLPGIVRLLVLGAGWLVCSFAALAFVVCLLIMVWSLFVDDPGGPMDPGTVGMRVIAMGIGIVSFITGMIGYMLLVIGKNLTKKPGSHFATEARGKI
jgi:ABC-type enterobactin transport system permease subunit